MRRRSTASSLPQMDVLRQVDAWPVPHAAAATAGAARAVHGDPGRRYAWASVTKPATAIAILVAAEEGIVDLDEPARAARFDAPAPARARVRPAVRGRPANRRARPAAHLLERRHRA